MKNPTFKILLILAITGVGLYCMLPPKQRLKLGIDLQGGTILVYQIDQANRPGTFQMSQMVEALSKRINPAGTLDVTIRPVGGDRVEIILPAADPHDVEAVQERITKLGQLEFRILATEKRDGPAVIRQAIDRFKRKEADPAPRGYEWVKLNRPDEFHGGSDHPAGQPIVQDGYALTKIPEDALRVTGDYLKRAEPTHDTQLRPAVGFNFDSVGTRRFAALTRKYQPEPDGLKYHLAIILDRQIMSAPVINSVIEGSGVIEGNFTAAEVDNYVAILNSGKLPAMLKPNPISKDTVTSTLGEDTIRMGTTAIAVAMIAVPLFMLAYYWFAGLVANVALVLNMIIILGFMGATHATLTLPGLAGLALTVGMAVDANVLIFERMREERDRGSSLAQTIRNGFDRAWVTILDSNLTTIITGFILYWLGTDQVKGFALTLIVGLVANLFTAVFVTRIIFDLWFHQGWLTALRMAHLIKTPSLDYVSPRFYFVIGSLIVNVLALGLAISRGSTLLDIDFTGGTAISLRLTDPSLGSEQVRAQAETVLPNVKVERLIRESAGVKEGLFLVRTTEADQAKVRSAMIEQFGDALARNRIGEWTHEAISPSGDESPPAFAGGERVRFTLNRAASPDVLARVINESLKDQNFTDPALHYELHPVERDEHGLASAYTLDTKQDVERLMSDVGARIAAQPMFEREDNFGPQVAGETQQKALLATVLSWAAMIAYLWFRFKKASYGLAAVISLIHDVMVALGFVALGGILVRYVPGLAHALLIDDFKIDLTVVSAFLTIIGYSVNDTIVIFDRLREIRGKTPYVTSEMINAAVNQSMSRTVLTFFTVILVSLIMYVWGGPGIHAFSFTMLLGCLSGSYSTIFIAAPVLYLFEGQGAATARTKGTPYSRAAARA